MPSSRPNNLVGVPITLHAGNVKLVVDLPTNFWPSVGHASSSVKIVINMQPFPKNCPWSATNTSNVYNVESIKEIFVFESPVKKVLRFVRSAKCLHSNFATHVNANPLWKIPLTVVFTSNVCFVENILAILWVLRVCLTPASIVGMIFLHQNETKWNLTLRPVH
jgi:hypothetical protein